MDKVKFIHLRVRDQLHPHAPPMSTGGYTIAYQCTKVLLPNGLEHSRVRVTWAQCSNKENYCRKIGRNVSSGRLEKCRGLIVDLGSEPEELITPSWVLERLQKIGFHELTSYK